MIGPDAEISSSEHHHHHLSFHCRPKSKQNPFSPVLSEVGQRNQLSPDLLLLTSYLRTLLSLENISLCSLLNS